MGRIKKYLLVGLGFGLAGAIGAAFGTGTAQAVVASLVQIANTTSSPVPSLNVTDPGRIAYQSQIAASCSSQIECVFVFPVVPAGHRVVVQHIIGIVTYSPAPTVLVATVGAGATNVSNFYIPIPPGVPISQFDWPALFYVDASTQAQVSVSLFGNSSLFGAGTEHVTLTGYELDCTVAACAPIATQ